MIRWKKNAKHTNTNNELTSKLTEMLMMPKIGSGILPALFRIRSNEPPS
jgi:hypothetical protein